MESNDASQKLTPENAVKKLLLVIIRNPPLTIEDLSALVPGTDRTTIENCLALLLDMNLVIKVTKRPSEALAGSKSKLAGAPGDVSEEGDKCVYYCASNWGHVPNFSYRGNYDLLLDIEEIVEKQKREDEAIRNRIALLSVSSLSYSIHLSPFPKRMRFPFSFGALFSGFESIF